MKIRFVLETNCLVFHSKLTQDNTNIIERVQKLFLWVILDDKYTEYHNAFLQLNVQNPKLHRTKLSSNFAFTCVESKKFSHLFKHRTNKCLRYPDIFDAPPDTLIHLLILPDPSSELFLQE